MLDSFFSALNRGLEGIIPAFREEDGMELVQVAILIAIAITVGLIFKERIGDFVDKVFGDLMRSSF